LATDPGFDLTGTEERAMTNLVLLSQVRAKKNIEGQENIVAGVKKLLKAAEDGELKGICFATVNQTDVLSFGVLHTPDCGAHELVGVSHMLNVLITRSAVD
jgi:hypothetical protein